MDKAGVEVSRGGEANCEVDGPKAEDEVVGAEAMMGNTREVGDAGGFDEREENRVE